MMNRVQPGDVLWEPTAELREHSNLARYMRWLAERRGFQFQDYHELWAWSATEIEAFWESVWQFFDVQASRAPTAVLTERVMPGAVWFPGAELNYAEHIFRHRSDDRPALVHESELRPLGEMSWRDLERHVASVSAGLRRMGVKRGDRVVAYMPNIPETIVAFLASASLGATWSSCSPDFGDHSVVDRFRQIEPVVLFATDGYRYGGRDFDRRATAAALLAALPTLRHVVTVPYLHPDWSGADLPNATPWSAMLTDLDAPLQFEPLPFDHPLWVLYSSGTTGKPKAFVHGHGGILLESLKMHAFHLDLQPDDRFFWFTSTGWVMWNILLSGLLHGSTVALFDGNPGYPDLGRLWRFAQDAKLTVVGTSAAFLIACLKAELSPTAGRDLSRIRHLGSTGSPLPVEGFAWVYDQVGSHVWLGSISGGTDVVCGFVGGSPLLPVRAGELQARCLGVSAQSFNEQGQPVIGQMGELVITEPMPSMPLRFWGDPGDQRYRESYFDVYPGVWRHGDWIEITDRGTAIVYGRSDATLNRLGVRMGSSEIYSAVEAVPQVLDSLIIGLELPNGGYFMPLFVTLREGVILDDDLTTTIKAQIRTALSPRYVPDAIYAIPDIPRTLSNKKMEVPIKKLFMGIPLHQVADLDAVQNPAALEYLASLADALALYRREPGDNRE
ncbi:MAG: acetoacetate--CoA ligase [Chloroflexota bacterium]